MAELCGSLLFFFLLSLVFGLGVLQDFGEFRETLADESGNLGADFCGSGVGWRLFQIGERSFRFRRGRGRLGIAGCCSGVGWLLARILAFGPAHPFVFVFAVGLGLVEGGDGAVGLGFDFVLLFFEIVVVPETRIIERRVGGVARVEDDVVDAGVEVSHAEIGAGGLQGIKKEAGSFVLDLLGDEQAHDLHEGNLNGVGVFEQRQDEGSAAATGARGVQTDAFLLVALVEETETVAAQRGRSALGAIDFEMLTTIWITGHESLLPLPWWSIGIIRLGWVSEINL